MRNPPDTLRIAAIWPNRPTRHGGNAETGESERLTPPPPPPAQGSPAPAGPRQAVAAPRRAQGWPGAGPRRATCHPLTRWGRRPGPRPRSQARRPTSARGVPLPSRQSSTRMAGPTPARGETARPQGSWPVGPAPPPRGPKAPYASHPRTPAGSSPPRAQGSPRWVRSHHRAASQPSCAQGPPGASPRFTPRGLPPPRRAQAAPQADRRGWPAPGQSHREQGAWLGGCRADAPVP